MTSQVTLGVHWGNKILGHSDGAKRNFHRSGDYPLISHPKSHQADELVCIGRESNPGLPRGRREFYH